MPVPHRPRRTTAPRLAAKKGSIVPLVIAMDGPSGSGKSSASKGVARALGLRYLDTGAMYRAMTWWMLREGVPVDDPAAVAARAGEPVIESGTDPDGPAITVDGTDVSAPIRTREVTNAVSAVSSVPAVRERLVALQREIIGAGGIVVEGRDIGTVVAPGAAVKVYLTASEEVRAARRARELAADPSASVTVTQAEQARRDRLDSTRTASPLAKAGDAVEIDSSGLGLDEVIEAVLRLARAMSD
jgi:cytidylate kinase